MAALKVEKGAPHRTYEEGGRNGDVALYEKIGVELRITELHFRGDGEGFGDLVAYTLRLHGNAKRSRHRSSEKNTRPDRPHSAEGGVAVVPGWVGGLLVVEAEDPRVAGEQERHAMRSKAEKAPTVFGSIDHAGANGTPPKHRAPTVVKRR